MGHEQKGWHSIYPGRCSQCEVLEPQKDSQIILKSSVSVFVLLERRLQLPVLLKAVADPTWFRAADLETSGHFSSREEVKPWGGGFPRPQGSLMAPWPVPAGSLAAFSP